MGTQRIEAFSDAVIAIAITLLVLELQLPNPDDPDIGRDLLDLWPSYSAYLVSFVTIGLMWVTHHFHFVRIKYVDRPALYLNLIVLMLIAFIPFPTGVFADTLRNESGEAIAATFYAGTLACASIAFVALSAYETRSGLLVEGVSDELPRLLTRLGLIPIALYIVAAGLAFVSPMITLVICLLIALANVVPGPKMRKIRDEMMAKELAMQEKSGT